jgi:hypothetical protein
VFHITKDVHEKLDYTFLCPMDDVITSVSFTQDNAGGLTVISCAKSTGVITDSDGIKYAAGKAVVLWVDGGTIGKKETIVITYETLGGRRLDETVVFNLVKET